MDRGNTHDTTEMTEGNLDDAVMQQAMQTSSHIENLEARNITLKQREEDNKLSFQKNNKRLANI